MTLDEQCEQATGEVGAIAIGSITQVCGALRCHTPSLEPGVSYRYVNGTLDFTTCGHKKATITYVFYLCFP